MSYDRNSILKLYPDKESLRQFIQKVESEIYDARIKNDKLKEKRLNEFLIFLRKVENDI